MEELTSTSSPLPRPSLTKFASYRNERTPDLIKLLGYPVEEHEIITEDGYILTVFRITHSDISPPSSNKIPVFCMHGSLSSSAVWLWQPSERALVFMLADAGYDVWIGNARGTSYSLKHTSFSIDNPRDPNYWKFSMHEYGAYDAPACINYITNHTAQPGIYWIGHSIGAGQFFTAVISKPELNAKIRTVFALAPACYIGNLTNIFLKTFAPLGLKPKFEKCLSKCISGRFVLPNIMMISTRILGNIPMIGIPILRSMWNFFFGRSSQLDLTTLPARAAHLPDEMSARAYGHLGQYVSTGEFKPYDYGLKLLNQKHYGSDTPPDYDWTKVDVPVVIYYSDGDNIVVSKDVERTIGALGSNVKEVNKIPGFNHVDFVFGIDADTFIYNKILETMNSRKYDPISFQ